MDDTLDEINELQDRDVERNLRRLVALAIEMQETTNLQLVIPLAQTLRELCEAAESPLSDMLDTYDEITRG